MYLFVFFFKQKTAYEVRISDWSSDVCSSDLAERRRALPFRLLLHLAPARRLHEVAGEIRAVDDREDLEASPAQQGLQRVGGNKEAGLRPRCPGHRKQRRATGALQHVIDAEACTGPQHA